MLRILVVEDERLARKGIVQIIKSADLGFVIVDEAKSGGEGLEKIIRLKPDIIVTDIRMPILSGIEMIEKARSYHHDAKYIIITAHDEFDYAVNALKLGAVNYLLKPFKDGELIDTINRIQRHLSPRPKDKNTFNLIDLPEGKSSQHVEQALRYIDSFYKENINVIDVASYVGISEGHFSRVFKKETGYTFLSYLNRYKIDKSLTLLSDSRLKIYEIAQKVGYRDTAYFNTIFRKYTNMSPSEFRDEIL